MTPDMDDDALPSHEQALARVRFLLGGPTTELPDALDRPLRLAGRPALTVIQGGDDGLAES